MKFNFFLLMLLISHSVFSQVKKSVEAQYIGTPLSIDGFLNEDVYSKLQPAKDFVQLQPYNGKPSFQPSEAYFFYDQTAIYVGAMLYDSAPDSIFNFISERDEIGMSDYFGVYLDPYNEGQLAYGFFITPAGTQVDIKAIKSDGDNEYGNWNAVWESKTRITDKGWVVEMRIPYSALRFPEKDIHTWGLNMFRRIRRYNSNNSWNFVDRNVSGFIHQEGELLGINNIKPPVRLSVSPYAATYLESKSGSKADFVYKGGLDLKYGVSESFTLDMMLVPDFGQIQSDDKQLNLSPYELYYDEKRQFFTEGTELFQRGGIFYSRRIGAAPKFSDNANLALKNNEVVDFNPTETQLVNASKISGRTTKGLGLGMLNAMSLPSYSTLKDTINGNTRKVQVQPFTNYNVSVVDQSLKNNSYISLINSNMTMAGNSFMANVTATEFQFRDKSKTYAINGKAGVSLRKDSARERGYFVKLGFEKNRGVLQYGVSQSVYSDQFNPNDMGYLKRNNELTTQSYLVYHKIEPRGIFREYHASVFWDYIRVCNPVDVFGNRVGVESYMLFKNNYAFNFVGGMESKRRDYYETRVDGRYFLRPRAYFVNMQVNTDERKPVTFYLIGESSYEPSTGFYSYTLYPYTNIRIGQRFQIDYEIMFNNQINDLGFVDKSVNNDAIYFARRDIKVVENVPGASFAFNSKAGLKLRLRHYWSGATNKTYYQLGSDGSLKEAPSYTKNNNENYNAFNIDMVFRWIFAPGSEMSVAWKNSILSSQNEVITNYWRNLDHTWHSSQTNSLSLKVLYYIDYNRLKWRKQ